MRLRVIADRGALATLVLLGGGVGVAPRLLAGRRERVTVTGVSGPDAGQIRSALVLAARNMTTLDVTLGQLHTAVAPYPMVKDLQVSTQFPHGMRIHVVEQLPVAALVAGRADGRRQPRRHAAPRRAARRRCRRSRCRSLPGGRASPTRRSERAGAPRGDARAAAGEDQPGHDKRAARPRRAASLWPEIYFGTPTLLHAKWVAATAVLAAPTSAGATYIDVTDPARPAAGVGAAGARQRRAWPTTGSQTTATGSRRRPDGRRPRPSLSLEPEEPNPQLEL